MTPKMEPRDVAALARERQASQRERRLSLLDQGQAGQKQASGLTSDLRSIYGPSIFSLFARPSASTPTSARFRQ